VGFAPKKRRKKKERKKGEMDEAITIPMRFAGRRKRERKKECSLISFQSEGSSKKKER